MENCRTYLFEHFENEQEELVYTELQPVQPSTSSSVDVNGVQNNISENEHDQELLSLSHLLGDMDELQDMNGSSDDTNINWTPDDDEHEADDNVHSSDESSNGDEYPDILNHSDPEQEVDEEEEEEDNEAPLGNFVSMPAASNVVMSKEGDIVWSKVPVSQVGRTPTRNVFRPPKSNVRYPTRIDSIVSTFKMIFTATIISEIVKMTNLEGSRNEGMKWKNVDVIEMTALLGLLIHLGARKLGLLAVAKIWSGASADNVAVCTRSMKRYVTLCFNLRFDDKRTRVFRRVRYVFSPLRDLMNKINNNLQLAYIPSESLTIDEQLVPWRGRCAFLQYLPSKPDKYGMKLFHICGSKTAYPLQMIPYLGKHGERKTNLGREIVKELESPYHNTGRNVTCDNFFTDLELADHLSRRGLSIVGTVRRNKPFLPRSFQTGKELKKFDSAFLFKDGVSIVAHKSNHKKHVVVLSTTHHSSDIDEGPKKKPVIVGYYNKIKGGVNTFDYMCHSFSCKRKSRRWPIVLFYNLLDTEAVAAHILYKTVHPEDTKSYKDRGHFNELLAKELLFEHLTRRMTMSKTTRRVKLSYEILKMEWSIKDETESATGHETEGQRKRKALSQGRCEMFPRKKDRKTRETCSKCNAFASKDHSKSNKVCNHCAE